MKISEMDREQLRDYLKSSGEIHRPNSESKAWLRAFELARAAGFGQLDVDCVKCWEKVQRFIKE